MKRLGLETQAKDRTLTVHQHNHHTTTRRDAATDAVTATGSDIYTDTGRHRGTGTDVEGDTGSKTDTDTDRDTDTNFET